MPCVLVRADSDISGIIPNRAKVGFFHEILTDVFKIDPYFCRPKPVFMKKYVLLLLPVLLLSACAGRSAVGICSRQYVSGLSIADCVFSGRRAARHAAA